VACGGEPLLETVGDRSESSITRAPWVISPDVLNPASAMIILQKSTEGQGLAAPFYCVRCTVLPDQLLTCVGKVQTRRIFVGKVQTRRTAGSARTMPRCGCRCQSLALYGRQCKDSWKSLLGSSYGCTSAPGQQAPRAARLRERPAPAAPSA
jgi:hypothetical protein